MHTLHNVSMGQLSYGPWYTYSRYLQKNSLCVIVQEHPLNASDHLPIHCSLELSYLRFPTTPAFPSQPLNWIKITLHNHYAKATNDIARGKDNMSIKETEHHLKYVCQELLKAADLGREVNTHHNMCTTRQVRKQIQ